MVSCATMEPCAIIMTRSQMASTSERMCVDNKTVRSPLDNRLMRLRNSILCSGSSPLVGSSRINSLGSWMRACARPKRCLYPFESVCICLCACVCRPHV